MINVNFISTSNENVASYRMRTLTPCQLLNGTENYTCSISNSCVESADINVFSKHWNPDEDAAAITKTGTKTVFDICDDHFDREMGRYYEYMCEQADIITCNTESMQERIYECTGKLARITSDPITFPKGKVTYSTDPQILWFGNIVNIYSILPYLNKLPNITIISNKDMRDYFRGIGAGHVKFKLWQPDLVEEEIHNYDIVLLPRSSYPWAVHKSPNRAVDSLMAGKFIVSDFPEVYGELDKYIFLGDIEQGIEFYRTNKDYVLDMLRKGQKFVQKKYGDDNILSQWEVALNSHTV